jgi:hypothetical protein
MSIEATVVEWRLKNSPQFIEQKFHVRVHKSLLIKAVLWKI